jgi:hypothetical protein
MFSAHYKTPHDPSDHALQLLGLLASQAARHYCRNAGRGGVARSECHAGAKYQVALAARSRNMRRELDQVSERIDDAIEASRSLTAELSLPILLKGDLLLALEWLARWMQGKDGLDVTQA